MDVNSFSPHIGLFLGADGSQIDLTTAFENNLKAFVNTSVFMKNLFLGKVFHGWAKYSLDVGATAYIQIKTGDSPVGFLVDSISTDSDKITCEFFENPTLTDGTSSITLINRNRTSLNTISVAAYSDPTVTSDGTKIDEMYAGGSLDFKGVGGSEITSSLPFRLKPNTNYILKLANDGSATGSVLIKFSLVEDI